MKAITLHPINAFAITLAAGAAAVSACAQEPTVPAQVEAEESYLDQPQTPGNWVYSDGADSSVAEFRNEEQTLLAIFCDKDTNRIGIERASFTHLANNRTMRISTETMVRDLTAAHVRTATITASLSPDDQLLDAMAITKGRFAVAVEGEGTLYLPAWVEVSRVIEDCR